MLCAKEKFVLILGVSDLANSCLQFYIPCLIIHVQYFLQCF